MYLVLASKSPRRKEILSQAGYHFKIDVSDVDETVLEKEPVLKVEAIAKKKGVEVFSRYNDSDVVVISADTIVVINGEILGKPKDKEDARRMISMLQGATHQVYTGVCIQSVYNQESFVEKTDVTIKSMTNEEIEEYISIKEPYDKAGSYAIQGVFSKYIDSINGDYYNVMGLPINKVSEHLKQYNFTEKSLGLTEEVPNIKICSRCGKSNKETNKYCIYCGSELVDSDTPIQVLGECPICHHINKKEATYCEICGTILNKHPNIDTSRLINNELPKTNIKQGDEKKNRLATIGLILGIVSCCSNFLCFTAFIGIIPGIIGIVLSIMGFKSQNRGIAIAGLITSIFGVIFNIIIIVFLLTAPTIDEGTIENVKYYVNSLLYIRK